jgi:hypothetical protein
MAIRDVSFFSLIDFFVISGKGLEVYADAEYHFTYRQTGRQADRQAGRQASRQIHKSKVTRLSRQYHDSG